jgi:hypothetical protein
MCHIRPKPVTCLLLLCYFLQAWKREVIRKHPKGLPKEYEEGFEVLEAEEGAGWDLVCQVRGLALIVCE